jgi:hypothetical protein
VQVRRPHANAPLKYSELRAVIANAAPDTKPAPSRRTFEAHAAAVAKMAERLACADGDEHELHRVRLERMQAQIEVTRLE